MSSPHFDENLLLGLAEGTLGAEALLETERHLDTCPDCRRAVVQVMRSTVDCESSEHDFPRLAEVDPANYALGDEFARGGMGRIRTARDLRLGRVVALKEMLLGGDDATGRFEREARITARLQHPSIVNVHEAGRWPSGEPFYAMTRVEGRSLDLVVAEAKTFDARLALLPNVLAVADALAFAHSRGVIHRDLKPKNVLVGVFGETVVIDWGLAKDLASRALESTSGPGTSGEETALGQVVGTPAYMPPEQAEGQPVDARADVYALGAMLDHVLSGKPAWEHSTAQDVLAAVRRGPPVPLAQREPGVSPDLLAIVERAMARAPQDRYPSARELADDLRRYQTGQLVGAHRYSLRQLLRRWVGRHRAALAVAAVSGVVLLTFGAVALQRVFAAQRLAQEQRARAEASRTDAEGLLGFMLHDLPEKLGPIGRLDMLDDVATRAVSYYEGQAEALEPAAVLEQALARRRLGKVLAAQGHLESAVAQYRAALAGSLGLVQREPGSVRARRELSKSQVDLGDTLLLLGDIGGALEAYRAALVLAEALAREAPEDLGFQQLLAECHGALGGALRWRDEGDALEELQAQLTICRALATKAPSGARQSDLSMALLAVGRVMLAEGDAPGAMSHIQDSLTIEAQRAKAEPTNADVLADLGLSEQAMGDALRFAGDRPGALVRYRAAASALEGLTTRDPANAELQRRLADARMRAGKLLVSSGDAVGALATFRAARAVQARLPSGAPSTPYLLGCSDDAIGLALLELNQTPEALAAFRSSVELLRDATSRAPRNIEWKRRLALSLDDVGDVLLELEDAAGALEQFRAAAVVHEANLASDPTNIEWQRDLSVSHERLGNALLRGGDAQGALVSYRALVALDEALLAKDPASPKRLRDRATSHDRVGEALMAMGDAPGALAEFRAEIAMWEGLLAKNPGSLDDQDSLALSHEQAGDALVAKGDAAAARAEFDFAIALNLGLAAKEPGTPAYRQRFLRLKEKRK